MWEEVCKTWYESYSKTSFKEGSVIQFLHKDSKELRYGMVDKAVSDAEGFVKIAEGTFIWLTESNSIWAFVADEHLEAAKAIIDASIDMWRIAMLLSTEGVKVALTATTADGLFGASSLAAGGLTWAGGLGMGAGLVVVIASAPSMLAATSLYKLSSAMENDSLTPQVVALGGAGGVLAGSTAGLLMVSESGTIAGLSASGMLSGLATLGGGSVMGSLAVGAAVVGSVAALTAVGVGGVVWRVSRTYVQDRLLSQRSTMLDLAVQYKFDNRLESECPASDGQSIAAPPSES
ncbi:unnamed protein product [Symbiodinium natans]|uniref:Uncharacterized protein n=1 Tax=Symbiodinium natans TaxID=878477 RepID=A0A812PJ52_9DINO|nr:unnamed protein product [Symbiodinium natans]